LSPSPPGSLPTGAAKFFSSEGFDDSCSERLEFGTHAPIEELERETIAHGVPRETRVAMPRSIAQASEG
jgi:hypothetical protein